MKKLFHLPVLLLLSILNPMPRRNRVKAGQRLAKGADLLAALATLLLLSTLNLQPSTCFAQGTAFTYQGRLADGANPASGIYDLRFTIYDAAGGGGVVAGPLTNFPTGVTNGLFTVTLDFGFGAFDGDARWLEIAVRTNGATGFATLTPRQPLTPTPYAILAGTASAVASTNFAVQLAGSALNGNNVTGAVPLLASTNFIAQANAWGQTGSVASATTATTATTATMAGMSIPMPAYNPAQRTTNYFPSLCGASAIEIGYRNPIWVSYNNGNYILNGDQDTIPCGAGQTTYIFSQFVAPLNATNVNLNVDIAANAGGNTLTFGFTADPQG